MIKVRFLSYIAKNIGLKQLMMEQATVRRLLIQLGSQFNSIKDLLDPESPELTIIADGKTLHFPHDLDYEVVDELVISPIIAGG